MFQPCVINDKELLVSIINTLETDRIGSRFLLYHIFGDVVIIKDNVYSLVRSCTPVIPVHRSEILAHETVSQRKKKKQPNNKKNNTKQSL